MQGDLQRARDGEIFLERFGFVDQDIGAGRGEPLIVNRVTPGVVGGDFEGERDRFGGVADVFVEGIRTFRRR
jgi:hypothetical protein